MSELISHENKLHLYGVGIMISPHKEYGTYRARTHWTVSLLDGFDGLRSCVIIF